VVGQFQNFVALIPIDVKAFNFKWGIKKIPATFFKKEVGTWTSVPLDKTILYVVLIVPQG